MKLLSLLFVGFVPVMGQQFVQQGPVMFGAMSEGRGSSVSMSADGNTALIGGCNQVDAIDVGADIFTRTRGVWSEGPTLLGSGAVGYSAQGCVAAISADASTAITGAPADNSGFGAAWFFTNQNGVWGQQGNKIVPDLAIGVPNFGASVALSADGTTALIGGPSDRGNTGAVWVFIRTDQTWIQQAKMVGGGAIGNAMQGSSVALSADGNTAIECGPGDNSLRGAAWLFDRSGGVWTAGDKLVSGATFGQCTSVTLSSDGNTALIGGARGAVVFSRINGVWTQGATLSGQTCDGFAAALSANGNKAIISGEATHVGVCVFATGGGAWTQQGGPLLVGVAGPAVALSADGSAAVVGNGPFINNGSDTGLFVFLAVPAVRDFNGDGLSDALQYRPADGTAYTALSNGNGAFSYVYNLFTSGFNILRAGDFNADNRADLALYNSASGLAYLGFGLGTGVFNFQSLFWSPGYDHVEMGDLNGDGKTDVLLYNSATGTVYTGISNGSGGFTYKYTLVSPNFTFVRLADFTGDGLADVLLYNSASGFAYLGVGDGVGGFSFHPLSVSPGYDRADIGELNGDGRMDVIFYSSSTGRAATGISDGMGGFAFRPLQFTPSFTSVRLADYSGDGKADVTVYNSANGVGYIGIGDGAGNFAFQSLFWSPGYDFVEPEDVNGDHRADVILYNSTTGTSYTGVSDGTGGFTYTYALWGPGKMLAR